MTDVFDQQQMTNNIRAIYGAAPMSITIGELIEQVTQYLEQLVNTGMIVNFTMPKWGNHIVFSWGFEFQVLVDVNGTPTWRNLYVSCGPAATGGGHPTDARHSEDKLKKDSASDAFDRAMKGI